MNLGQAPSIKQAGGQSDKDRERLRRRDGWMDRESDGGREGDRLEFS